MTPSIQPKLSTPSASLPPAPCLGRVHSIDTCCTTDGPGIRAVVFLQGCPLRCHFCHNPDTWQASGGQSLTVEETFQRLLKNQAYFKHSGGGITVSGGEPLLQLPFVMALFKLAKKSGIHTTLDTSGYTPLRPELTDLLAVTDLVMLDIKDPDPKQHQRSTHVDLAPIEAFLKLVAEQKKTIWIRHVLVPNYTLEEASLIRLAQFLEPYKAQIKQLDLLPYHPLGEHKWQRLGLQSPLEGTPAVTPEQVAWAYQILKQA